MKDLVLQATVVVWWIQFAFGRGGLWERYLDGKIVPMSKGG